MYSLAAKLHKRKYQKYLQKKEYYPRWNYRDEKRNLEQCKTVSCMLTVANEDNNKDDNKNALWDIKNNRKQKVERT